MRLNPGDLRRYAQRDWGAPERLARPERACASVDEKVRIAVALYEATRRMRPDWPDDATRHLDLQAHLRLRSLLDRARHVGAP